MRSSIALLVFITGCSSTAQQAADVKAKEAWTAYEPYAHCVVIASDALATQDEDPYYLVVAARTSCGEKELVASEELNRIYGLETARAVKASFDRRTNEAAITRIIKHRARA